VLSSHPCLFKMYTSKFICCDIYPYLHKMSSIICSAFLKHRKYIQIFLNLFTYLFKYSYSEVYPYFHIVNYCIIDILKVCLKIYMYEITYIDIISCLTNFTSENGQFATQWLKMHQSLVQIVNFINPKVHDRIHKNPPKIPILSHVNPLHTPNQSP
jgi:hypothetical protein